MSDSADRPFRWDDLDQRLISPKAHDIAEEMQKRISAGERRITFQGAQSHNSAYYVPAFLEFHEAVIEEWAAQLYAAYKDAWVQQNQSLSPEFIRAVRDHALAQLFTNRASTVVAILRQRAKLVGEQVNSEALGGWNRTVDRMRSRWQRKLEGEALALEYKISLPAKREYGTDASEKPLINSAPRFASRCGNCFHPENGHEGKGGRCLLTTKGWVPSDLGSTPFVLCPCEQFVSATTEPVSGQDVENSLIGRRLNIVSLPNDKARGKPPTKAYEWRLFRERFLELAKEELAVPPTHHRDRYLRAYIDYEQEGSNYCSWHLSDGPGEEHKARFLVEATGAGMALGDLVQPDEYWLHRVYTHLLASQSNLLFAATERAGMILRISEASSLFCSVLERESLVRDGHAGSEPPRFTESQPGEFRSQKRGTRRERSEAESKRLGVIFGAIQAGLRGVKYCICLDRGRVRIPPRWIEDGCSSTYAAAYKSGEPWRKRIQHQKNKFQTQYSAMSPSEREKLIQSVTPPTPL